MHGSTTHLPRAIAAAAATSALLVCTEALADDASAGPGENERPAAPASEAAGFGRRGQIVLDDIVGAGFGSALPSTLYGAGIGLSGWLAFGSVTEPIGSGATASSSSLYVAPEVDWFVTDHLSIGGNVSAMLEQTKEEIPQPASSSSSSGFALSFEPRVGYAVRLTGGVAMWPRAGLSYGILHAQDDAGAWRVVDHWWGARLEVPFVFRLGSHVYLDAGPELLYASTSSDPSGAMASIPMPVGDSQMLRGGARASLALAF